ncbi:PREDICTED: adenosine receptor A1-like [Thamnophis sirtalis]|uniref:Adenosine receptor A1 n=1 Tax=Thamnophis sirtalis TaxID=35019 RepID=A0A6I9YCE2_9SAUR|nr:PREDICTED: adenosine receptor A1-like [Thamnophis sirtalis]
MSEFNPLDIVYIFIEVLIALVSIPGNILVIWAVKVNKSLRDATFYFIGSLAVADAAVGTFAVPLAITISRGPSMNFYQCLMLICPLLILTESSILALLAIAVDRYLRVKIPIRYKNVMTPRRAGVAIGCCWLISLLVGMIPLFGWNENEKDTFNSTCKFDKVISMKYMVYFNFFGCVLPPLVFMLIIYIAVFKIIRKQLSKKFGSNSACPEKYYGKELKIAKSLALVLFLFALCWLPLHICNFVALFTPELTKLQIFTPIAVCMTHLNSAMNPIIYAFRIKKFRTTFLQIWNQYFHCKMNRHSNNIGDTDIAI